MNSDISGDAAAAYRNIPVTSSRAGVSGDLHGKRPVTAEAAYTNAGVKPSNSTGHAPSYIACNIHITGSPPSGSNIIPTTDRNRKVGCRGSTQLMESNIPGNTAAADSQSAVPDRCGSVLSDLHGK